MPWTVTDPMLERAALVAAYNDGLYSVTELAERHGVSRKTAYKWLDRYQADGAEGLSDRSRTRRGQALRTPPEVEQLLVACRRKHPTWGPRKLVAYLAPRHRHLAMPSSSTAGAILKRHGLVEPRSRRRRPAHPGRVPLDARRPNDVWCADFKGQFLLGDATYCYPLTVTDACSRFVLCCHGLDSVAQAGAIPVFDRLFRERGLPGAIRTDNGVPFATQAICGLSALNVWWIKLGIGHQRIEPGRPEQNGRHERMHRVLKAETTRPPGATMSEQQLRFNRFRDVFNQERPHEALNMATPSGSYTASRYSPV
jgi:putative transposase